MNENPYGNDDGGVVKMVETVVVVKVMEMVRLMVQIVAMVTMRTTVLGVVVKMMVPEVSKVRP